MINLNKDLLLLLVITSFLLIFFTYIVFNILDMLNPVFIEEEHSILTPQLEKLLVELEQKYR